MKKNIIKAVSLILMLIIILCFSSCVAPKKIFEPTAVAFVLGVHNNFPFQSALASFKDDIYDACYSYGEVTLVVVDGEGFIGGDYNVKKPDKDIDNSKRKMLAEQNTNAIMSKLSSISAKAPEVDTLQALTLAADKLQASKCSVKKVYVVDSALSTTGVLNFAKSQLIENKPENIVGQLKDINALPNLKGVDVEIIGMGQTCGNQQALTYDMKHKLNSIWEEIIEASGASSIRVNSTPLSATDAKQNLPHVSNVTVIREDLTYFVDTHSEEIRDESETADSTTENLTFQEVIRLDEKSIKFNGNTAFFCDEGKAYDELEPIGALLKNNSSVSVYLAGMTASVGGDGVQLSLERALAVKKLLLEMGCNEEQILCVGLGRTENHLRIDDLDENGNLVEEKAMLNRAVFLFGKGSDTAVKLGLDNGKEK